LRRPKVAQHEAGWGQNITQIFILDDMDSDDGSGQMLIDTRPTTTLRWPPFAIKTGMSDRQAYNNLNITGITL